MQMAVERQYFIFLTNLTSPFYFRQTKRRKLCDKQRFHRHVHRTKRGYLPGKLSAIFVLWRRNLKGTLQRILCSRSILSKLVNRLSPGNFCAGW